MHQYQWNCTNTASLRTSDSLSMRTNVSQFVSHGMYHRVDNPPSLRALDCPIWTTIWTTVFKPTPLKGADTEQPGHRSGWNEITPHLKLTFSGFQWPRSTVHGPLNWFECYLLLFLISFNLRLSGLFNPFAASFIDAVTKTRPLWKSPPDNPVPWRCALGHGSG